MKRKKKKKKKKQQTMGAKVAVMQTVVDLAETARSQKGDYQDQLVNRGERHVNGVKIQRNLQV